jgi:hypothetical protein
MKANLRLSRPNWRLRDENWVSWNNIGRRGSHESFAFCRPQRLRGLAWLAGFLAAASMERTSSQNDRYYPTSLYLAPSLHEPIAFHLLVDGVYELFICGRTTIAPIGHLHDTSYSIPSTLVSGALSAHEFLTAGLFQLCAFR